MTSVKNIEKYLEPYSLPVSVELKTLYYSHFSGILLDIPYAKTEWVQCVCIEKDNQVKYYGTNKCLPYITNFDKPKKNTHYSKTIYGFSK